MDSSSTSSSSLTFYDFLDRMRNPASVDLVRAIKSFIVSFSFHAANSENDSRRLQEFLVTMETVIRDHPLWAGATAEEIDSAVEGLEKYVMTKLFSRTFASSPEDVKCDQEISEKICLLQHFVRPQHLDIPEAFQNEASWLLAEKELQKMNAFKAPREKLLCILSCCRVINNLLLNVSMSEDHISAGADDFLPVVIYVTIKYHSESSYHLPWANPPQLHSNLKFIQLYRRQSKLVSEAAYYFTNLVSVESFILNLNAKSLSMDESDFENNMQMAILANEAMSIGSDPMLLGTSGSTSSSPFRSHGENYPFVDAEFGELRVGDVEKLLNLYKEVVGKYSRLCEALRILPIDNKSLSLLMKDGHLINKPFRRPDETVTEMMESLSLPELDNKQDR